MRVAILLGSTEQQVKVVAHEDKGIDKYGRKLQKNQCYCIDSINVIFLIPEQQLFLQLFGIDLKARFHVFCFKVRSTFTFY